MFPTVIMKNFASVQIKETTAPQKNLEIIRRQIEKWASGDLDVIAEDFALDTRNHGEAVGRAGVRMVIEDIWRTFPDWRGEILEILAEKDSVVVRLNVSGTHRGIGRFPVNGGMLVGVEPTGKSFEAQHIHWYKMRDGEIVDHYANRDDLEMMRQLGLLPSLAV
jgi:predicted ester cyclase